MSLITPAVYREHEPGTTLSDDSLQRLIDANEARMVRILGPHYQPGIPATETFDIPWQRRLLNLNQAAGSIVSVRSRPRGDIVWLPLAADDYALSDSGLLLYRLTTGTNSASYWHGIHEVTYVPAYNLEERVGALLRMVGIDVTRGPSTGGVTSRTMGSWSESYGGSPTGPDADKDTVLGSLLPHGGMVLR